MADVLLLTTITVRDTQIIHNDGILATLECQLWNTKFLLWGLFIASTWNIVTMTIERYVLMLKNIFSISIVDLISKTTLCTTSCAISVLDQSTAF